MNTNERNGIVKLIQPNILPNAVEIEVKVTDDEQVFGQYASNEMVENVDEELANLDVNIDDDEENEEGRNGEDDEKHEGDDAAGISWSLNDLMRQSY